MAGTQADRNAGGDEAKVLQGSGSVDAESGCGRPAKRAMAYFGQI